MHRILQQAVSHLIATPVATAVSFLVIFLALIMPAFVPLELRVWGLLDTLIIIAAGGALVWAMLGQAGWGWTARLPKLIIALLLTGLVLAFLAIVAVFASAMASLAIMAGAGFDFSAEDQAAAMAAFQTTPGWQLCLVCFALAAVFLFAAFVRSLPVIAATMDQGRVVALEAFMWTRGGLRALLPAAALMLAAPLGVALWASLGVGASWGNYVQAAGLACAALIWCALSVATYHQMRPANPKLPEPS